MKSYVSQISRRYLLPGVVAAAMASTSLLAACGEKAAEDNGSWRQQGQLLAWDREVWIVDTVPIIVPESLDVAHEQMLGSRIDASGSYDDSGRMVADMVSLTTGSLPDSTLEPIIHEGTITSVSDSIWVVGGTAIVVPDGLVVSGIEGVDAATLTTGGYSAKVTGHQFGENGIVASAIEVVPASTQDGNSAPQRTPVIVEPSEYVEPTPQPTPMPPAPPAEVPAESPAEAPAEEPAEEPVREPEPPSHDGDGGNDDDDDDDDNGEKKPDKDKKDKNDD